MSDVIGVGVHDSDFDTVQDTNGDPTVFVVVTTVVMALLYIAIEHRRNVVQVDAVNGAVDCVLSRIARISHSEYTVCIYNVSIRKAARS